MTAEAIVPGPDRLLQMYAGMLKVRLFEERVRELFAGGRIPGFLHTSIGQEGIAVGVTAALDPDDDVLSTHRGHGHLVAKDGSLRGLMAELYGKATGICHGKGGTMHIADASVRYLGANGVPASGCVLAPGVGLSIKHRKSGQVVVTFFGDGAANRGPFHDGVARAAARARAGDGPSLIEAHTIRWVGHHEGDAQAYRSRDEVTEGRRTDPIARLAAVLTERRLLDATAAARIREGVVAEIDDAVAFAESSPLPEPRDALTDLFAHYPWSD